MDRRRLAGILEEVRSGTVGVEEAVEALSGFTGEELGFAHLDTHRQLRTGIPEVVYGEGKTAEQVVHLLDRLHAAGQVALATRVDDAKAAFVRAARPDVVDHRVARVLVWTPAGGVERSGRGTVGVVCAGTSDLPVAEEAAVVLEALGHPILRVRDVGVAGLHRLMGHLPALRRCTAVVVVAGMEGALASVVAGLVGRPVIAVPTSVGYGAAFHGVAALLAMLNSCAPGVSVVNIDNGFGAACQAALINRGTEGEAP